MDIRVGAIGRTISTLSPSGYVDFEGMRRPAKSEGAYIPVGTAVIVLSGNAFGLVVRELEPGTAPPTIAPVGESIGKAEHQLTGADVAAIEREQQWREGVELRHRMKVGSAIAGFLGIVVGLASAAIGSHFNWDNVNDSIGQSLLFWSVRNRVPRRRDRALLRHGLACTAGLSPREPNLQCGLYRDRDGTTWRIGRILAPFR